MNTEMYKSLLTRHIVALLVVVLLGLALCVAGIILVKKLDLAKWLYALCIGVFIVGIICSYDAIPMYLDLKNDDYIEYTGIFEQYAGSSWSRDSTKLSDGMVLHSERMVLPYGKHTGRIVYAKRSHIVVEIESWE
ncbi:MAG: hypothetical protein E7629_03520 [Ruminococcaceae bacterium]|nr:hypothetical protein [Oscillospiraceae bacterium]